MCIYTYIMYSGTVQSICICIYRLVGVADCTVPEYIIYTYIPEYVIYTYRYIHMYTHGAV